MALAFGQAYDVPAVALRFFNIYGSRQALNNPYTGVAAIFSGRMLAGRAPVIYEDGRQQRDFVHVSDIVQACCLAMENPAADYQVFNVGTGQPVSVLQVAELQALCDALGHAAQQEMADAIECGDEVGRERAYGKWLGVRGILRAVEARSDEWTPLESQMLERIDWQREQFRFPGLEAFDVAQTEPGADSD